MPSTAKGGSQVDILTIVAVLPFVAVCIVAAFLEAEQSRSGALNDALARARTTMSAVDFELRGHVLTLQAMATSRSFEKGDLRAIYDESKRILGSQPAWLNVGLQSGNGTQLFNAIEPFGTLPVPQADQESLERTLELGTPQIGNVAVGPAIDKAATRVRVPVHAQGKVRYVISVPLKPQLFEDILRSQQLPPGWEISLLDGKDRLVASVPSHAAGDALGRPAPVARRKIVPLAPRDVPIRPGRRRGGLCVLRQVELQRLAGERPRAEGKDRGGGVERRAADRPRPDGRPLDRRLHAVAQHLAFRSAKGIKPAALCRLAFAAAAGNMGASRLPEEP